SGGTSGKLRIPTMSPADSEMMSPGDTRRCRLASGRPVGWSILWDRSGASASETLAACATPGATTASSNAVFIRWPKHHRVLRGLGQQPALFAWYPALPSKVACRLALMKAYKPLNNGLLSLLTQINFYRKHGAVDRSKRVYAAHRIWRRKNRAAARARSHVE